MLVLDANILIRAVLGSRVLFLLRRYAEARMKLPGILDRRRIPIAPAMAMLDALSSVVGTVELTTFGPFESNARQRLARRDEDDWPVLAAALAQAAPGPIN
jgi:PIN domain